MTKKLYRSCKNRIIGGVAGGIGEYFNIDPIVIRILFVISILPGGIGLIIYLASWLLIPEQPNCEDEPASSHKPYKYINEESKKIIGAILITIGALFLIKNLSGFDVWNRFWPIALIIIGFVIIAKNIKRQ